MLQDALEGKYFRTDMLRGNDCMQGQAKQARAETAVQVTSAHPASRPRVMPAGEQDHGKTIQHRSQEQSLETIDWRQHTPEYSATRGRREQVATATGQRVIKR